MVVSRKQLFDVLFQAFVEAGEESSKIKIDGLGFYAVNGDCDLTMRPDDKPATEIASYFYSGKADDGSEFTFDIHRIGKALIAETQEPLLFEVVEMNGIDLKTGAGSAYYQAHHHDKDHAMFFILRGEGALFVGDQWHPYKAGDEYDVPARASHAFVLNARAGKSIFVSAQRRPISCTENGAEVVDFYTDPTPLMPDWVLKIQADNQAAIQIQA